jgi:mannitol-1-phosphate/altronate dehydrogenase
MLKESAMKSIPLNQRNLNNIQSSVKVPSYFREELKASIVHIGLGHFHRSHLAAYLDELLEMNVTDTGIFEINLIPESPAFAQNIKNQDYLYTLVAKNSQGEEQVRIIGSICDYLCAPDDPQRAIARIADEQTELVSLTVTEKGYCYDTASEDLDWNNPGIIHDKQESLRPVTTIGYLASALRLRFETSKKPITIMSCDNFPSNGNILKKCLLSFFRETQPNIIPWIENQAAFPLSMVDRITPSTTDRNIQYVEEKYGIQDGWTVCCEDFRQWILEDNFKSPIPPFAKVGVQLTAKVEPYEFMKIRLLNGSHSALSYLAYLMGYREVAAAMGDPVLQTFIRNFYMEEITQTLSPVEGIDLETYKDTLINRFSNVHIGDHILRLAMDGSKKIPNAILNPLVQIVNQGGACDAIITALAGWARFLEGTDESGHPIPIEDSFIGDIRDAAKEARREPLRFLYAIGVHIIEAAKMEELASKLTSDLDSLHQNGSRQMLSTFITGHGR